MDEEDGLAYFITPTAKIPLSPVFFHKPHKECKIMSGKISQKPKIKHIKTRSATWMPKLKNCKV